MNILIVQTGFLGDIILSTPVITGLKKKFPEADIYFLTTPAGKHLIENDPDVFKTLVYDKRGKDKGMQGIRKMADSLKEIGFSRAYSLHKSYRTSLMLYLSKIPFKKGFKKAKLSFLYDITELRNKFDHDALRNLSILKSEVDIKSFDQSLRLFPGDKEKIRKDLNLKKDDKIIFLSPGSAWKTKMWHTKGYNDAAKHFESMGYKVIISGSMDEKDVCDKAAFETNALNVCGKYNLSDIKTIMSLASLVVCNDSMALHMSSALKIPSVTIFCSTVPEFGYGPWKNKSIVIEEKMECRPCGRHGHKECPVKSEACMNISSDKVINACEEILNG